MVDSGADIVDIDYMVDMERAVALSQGKCAICSQINPTATILQETEEVRRCVAAGNNKTIISSGCEIPRMSPEANVTAIAQELKLPGQMN